MDEVTVKSKSTSKPSTESATLGDGASRMVVIDIGKKQRKKAIRRLRKGRGRLVAKVEDAVKDVQEETGDNAPVVVVVVRKKKNKCRRWLW